VGSGYLSVRDEQAQEVGLIEFMLRVDYREEKRTRLLLLGVSSEYQVADVVLSLQGTTFDHWAFAEDINGNPGPWQEWGAALLLGGTLPEEGKYFWVRARATEDEEAPQDDDSVALMINYRVVPKL